MDPDVAAEPSVLVTRRDNVMVITLNRPRARNAIDLASDAAIGAALEEAERDPSVRVVIVTGAGDKAFSAGADLKERAAGVPAGLGKARDAWGFAGMVRHPISKPVIAAVNGSAFGGGFEMVLSCDLVVMADAAVFGLPEVKRGFFPGGGGAFRAPRQLPPKIGMEMLLTGEPMTAARAYELGLVNAVVPHAEVMPVALALAARIAANAPLAVQAAKRVALGVVDGVAQPEADAWTLSRRERLAVAGTEDAKEGPRAFVEGRPPNWTAR